MFFYYSKFNDKWKAFIICTGGNLQLFACSCLRLAGLSSRAFWCTIPRELSNRFLDRIEKPGSSNSRSRTSSTAPTGMNRCNCLDRPAFQWRRNDFLTILSLTKYPSVIREAMVSLRLLQLLCSCRGSTLMVSRMLHIGTAEPARFLCLQYDAPWNWYEPKRLDSLVIILGGLIKKN